MKLLLIRHGDCFQEGQDPSLTKSGILQSKLLAKRLSKLSINKVYSSDLNRAFQTFEEYHKLAIDTPFQKTESLREIYRVLIGGAPKEGTSLNRESKDKGRIELFIKQITSMPNDETVVLFTHGNLIRYFLARLLDADPRKTGGHLEIAPSSISLIEINKDKVNINFINNTEHLTGKYSSDSYFFNNNSDTYVD